MEVLSLEMFAEYGSLAAGWGVAYLLWRRNEKTQDARAADLVRFITDGHERMASINLVLQSIKDILASGDK